MAAVVNSPRLVETGVQTNGAWALRTLTAKTMVTEADKSNSHLTIMRFFSLTNFSSGVIE